MFSDATRPPDRPSGPVSPDGTPPAPDMAPDRPFTRLDAVQDAEPDVDTRPAPEFVRLEPAAPSRHLGALATGAKVPGENEPAAPSQPDETRPGTDQELTEQDIPDDEEACPLDFDPPPAGLVDKVLGALRKEASSPEGEEEPPAGAEPPDPPEPPEPPEGPPPSGDGNPDEPPENEGDDAAGVVPPEEASIPETPASMPPTGEERPAAPYFVPARELRQELGVSRGTFAHMHRELFALVLGGRTYRFPEPYTQALSEWRRESGVRLHSRTAGEFAQTDAARAAIREARADFRAAVRRATNEFDAIEEGNLTDLLNIHETTVDVWRREGLPVHSSPTLPPQIARPILFKYCSWQYPKSFPPEWRPRRRI